jgi:hypothetical protein
MKSPIRAAGCLFAAAACVFGFAAADPQAYAGKWRVDLDKSNIASGPKPTSFDMEIGIQEDRIVLQQKQMLGVRVIERTQRLPLIDQEAPVNLPQGIVEMWRTTSSDSSSIESEAHVIQGGTEIGWQRLVLRISGDGNQLTYDLDRGGNAQDSRYTDHLVLTRVQDKN